MNPIDNPEVNLNFFQIGAVRVPFGQPPKFYGKGYDKLSEISAMPANIVSWLNEQEVLSSLRFMTEFPAEKKAIPLTSPIVAVGIEKMNITDSFVENDEGVLEKNDYCRVAAIRIRLAIHVPFSQGGEKCYDAFTDIIDCLTFGSDLEIVNSGCDDIKADRDTDAFVLSAWINVNASFCPAASSSVSFGSFMMKDLLCARHIYDEEVHISGRERDYLEEPFVSSYYMGNGRSSRSISTEFEPRAVFVACSGYPPVMIDFEDGLCRVYSAFAGTYGNMCGISITSTGFTIDDVSESSVGIETCLNESGLTYFFVAFK